MPGTIVAGALGNCVHVAGVVSFLRIAEQIGYKTVFLGAAVPVDRFVEAVRKYHPEVVGISYRLTPEVAENLLEELHSELGRQNLLDKKFVFGGTPPVCKVAEDAGWIDRCFDGLENPDAVWAYLRGIETSQGIREWGNNLLDRIKNKHPYPILRHHFGLPSMADTVDGIEKIAQSQVLDVISVAPDQNAQESFFRPHLMDPRMDGAGGVPVRTREDLIKLYDASRCGNHPLLRIYSGTRDLIKWAELAQETVHNAWAAVPLCWYSALDGRSNRTPEEAIRENQECMRWHGERCIPVEVNEPHHWAMRDAHDTISVVMAYLSAYNAKRMGVSLYVSQYMFNSPAGMSGAMDLAKILAQIEMVESQHAPDFFSVRQVRAGLLHLSPRMNIAKGQLAASTTLALTVKPHIIHVVGYCEGDHAASADDVIESCEIVQGVLRNCLTDMPNMAADPIVQDRKNALLAEAEVLLKRIYEMGKDEEDPLISPTAIARAIKQGLLDAPHLMGNPYAAGSVLTKMIDGAVFAVDEAGEHPISEKARLENIKTSGREGQLLRR